MANFAKPSRDFALSLLIDFLKSNGAYESFERNYSKTYPFSNIAFLKSFHPKRYIALSFCWKYTPEGNGYWADLDSKWRLVVNFFNF